MSTPSEQDRSGESLTAVQVEGAEAFLALHTPGTPLLVPNPWDVGSAKLFASLGFSGLATTSAGFAFALGRPDHGIDRDEALAHSADIVAATPLPVTADLENGFGDDPSGVADTVTRAAATGLAGCSIEDTTGDTDDAIFDIAQAVERVAAAVEAAHTRQARLALTARADNYFHGRADLPDTIKRLQAFEAAGADVVYAPGLTAPDDIARVVDAVSVPVNVLAFPGGPTVPELADLGVARVSVGSAFSLVSVAATARAARELLEDGTLGFWDQAAAGLGDAAAAVEVAGTTDRRPESPD